jgi:hypothetical protein
VVLTGADRSHSLPRFTFKIQRLNGLQTYSCVNRLACRADIRELCFDAKAEGGLTEPFIDWRLVVVAPAAIGLEELTTPDAGAAIDVTALTNKLSERV